MHVQKNASRPFFHKACGHTKIRCLEFTVSDKPATADVPPEQDLSKCLEVRTLDGPCPDCYPLYKQCPMSGFYYKVGSEAPKK